ncbi:NAD-dependent epimerase/dehydratase family protein [Agromyces sp. NPDC058484]|uniref:NAD-dependent epimerase/dehydratase family protein n=1 Tax=Agromyces sp. NPDC058484 TaxID=3346524 RepID=UPI0036604248
MTRRVLVAGGTGFIGSHVAERLAQRGDRVTVLSRGAARAEDLPAIGGMPRLVGDYTAGDLTPRDLEHFDAVVFAAGNDIRHVAADAEDDAFWRRVQRDGVPAFAEVAKRAGVGRFVQIGSYYHQLHPEWAETMPYVAARRDADEGARALTGDGFAAITLNPPSIVGTTPGRGLRRFARMIAWVRGELPEPELFAPTGGTNYMSVRSLSQAVAGALDAGEPGRAYLVGDVNLTYRDYFQLLAEAAGSARVIEERDEPHPFQPDRFIVQGRGNVIAYEPDAAEVALLGYDRADVRPALERIVKAADAERG